MPEKPEAKPRIPKVGEYVCGQGTLVKVEDVTPPPPPKQTHYIFEVIEAHCEVRLGKRVLDAFEYVWDDLVGKGSSVKPVIDAAKKYAAKWQLGPKSDLEVVAVKVVRHVRRHIKAGENFYDETFRGFETIKVGYDRYAQRVVWSSKRGKK